MALIPATLTVNFISNYAGPHRVCWRLNNTGLYDCTTVVTCTGGGAPCSAIINVMVDNDTCDPVIFDGYVQAACEDVASLAGRVVFSSIFIPNPACKGYTLLCESSGIAGANIINGGTGYNPMVPPTVTIAPGPGVGAIATAIVGNAGILTQTITNGGTGYVNGTYINVPAVNITSSGVGATYTVVVTGNVITSVTITDPSALSGPKEAGTGYAVNDTFEFNNTDIGGAGTGGVITVNTLNTGIITFISVPTSGSGYNLMPSITVSAPGAGIQATFTGIFLGCANYNAGYNCDGITRKPNMLLALGESTIVCSPTPPPNPENPLDGLSITQNACCYKCRNYTIEIFGEATIIYTDCLTKDSSKTKVTGSVIAPFTATACIVEGSLLVQSDAIVNITSLLSC